MFSIFFKVFGSVVLAFFTFFMFRFPEQSVVLLVGLGLVIFAFIMRSRRSSNDGAL